MNHSTNDKGECVISVGAPGSLARVQCEYPALIERLNALFSDSVDCYGRAVDRAIEMIRQAGIRSEMETNNLLSASHYGNEKPGSVAALVVSVATPNKELFKAAYVRHLKQCVRDFPGVYAWRESESEAVAARMLAALDRGDANINSHAFKRTCKEMGIKHTRKAIAEFLR